jgi:hypothetical protein
MAVMFAARFRFPADRRVADDLVEAMHFIHAQRDGLHEATGPRSGFGLNRAAVKPTRPRTCTCEGVGA